LIQKLSSAFKRKLPEFVIKR